MVYEYAANGSLDDFLKNDDMRARLSAATTRLSIMYQVASAIDFLHTGVKGFKVLYRDIKSSNICLTDDFTPRLIDCGLGKFVEGKHDAFSPVTSMQPGSSRSRSFGTHGYVCPEYIVNKAYQGECDYIAAYDVYSFGVVMAELILGRLNDGRPINVLEAYVLNGKTPIVDGWKQLEKDADNQADWNADALKLICKTAIGCLILIAHGRLSTDKLLDLLKHAINTQAGNSGDVPKDAVTKLDAILLSIGKPNFESEDAGLGFCDYCEATARSAVVTCSEGHAFCSKCLEEAMVKPGAKNGDRQLPCLIDKCSSLPFQDRDLYLRIKSAAYHFFFVQALFDTFTSKVDSVIPVVDEINDRQKKSASVVDRHVSGWALRNANAEQLKLCPSA